MREAGPAAPKPRWPRGVMLTTRPSPPALALPSTTLCRCRHPGAPAPENRPLWTSVPFSLNEKGAWWVGVLCLGRRPLGRSHPAALCGGDLASQGDALRRQRAQGCGGFSLCHMTQQYGTSLASHHRETPGEIATRWCLPLRGIETPFRSVALRGTTRPWTFGAEASADTRPISPCSGNRA